MSTTIAYSTDAHVALRMVERGTVVRRPGVLDIGQPRWGHVIAGVRVRAGVQAGLDRLLEHRYLDVAEPMQGRGLSPRRVHITDSGVALLAVWDERAPDYEGQASDR